jgi:hypothetical protein
MPFPQMDRFKLNIKSLNQRKHKAWIERDRILPTAKPRPFSAQADNLRWGEKSKNTLLGRLCERKKDRKGTALDSTHHLGTRRS